MNPITTAGILLGLVVLILVMRRMVAAKAAPAVRQAVLKQPDSVTLARAANPPWRNLAAVEGMTSALMQVGFVDAGTYTVDAMPGVIVRILVKADESVSANLYDHPKREPWAELVTRYADGSSATATSLPDLGVPRPDWIHTIRHPGAGPVDLYRDLVRQRPAGAMKQISPASAEQDFETGYVSYMTWLKNKQLSPAEIVAMVARRKAATGGR